MSEASAEDVITLIILAKATKDFKSAEAFLKKRGWNVFMTDNLKDGMALITEHKANWVLLSVNLPNANTSRLPGFFAQTFNCQCVAFGEDSTPQTALKLSNLSVPMIHGKPSGPGIQTKIKNILQQQQSQLEKSTEKNRTSRWKDDSDATVKISSKGGGDNNSVVIKSSTDSSGNQVVRSSKDGDGGGISRIGSGEDDGENSMYKASGDNADDEALMKASGLQTDDQDSGVAENSGEGEDSDDESQNLDAADEKSDLIVQKGVRGEAFNENQEGMAALSFHETEDGVGDHNQYSEIQPGAGMGDALSSSQQSEPEVKGETKFNPADSLEDQETPEANPSEPSTETPEIGEPVLTEAQVVLPDEAKPPKVTFANGPDHLKTKKPEDMTATEFFFFCVHRTLEKLGTGAPEQMELREVQKLGVIAVKAEGIEGFLYLAHSDETKIDDSLIARFKELLSEFLQEKQVKLDIHDGGVVDVRVQNFPAWSELYAQFADVAQNDSAQMMSVFVDYNPVLPQLTPIAAHQGKVQVQMKDILAEKDLPCDFYVYLPITKRYFLYLKKGGSVTTEQKQRWMEEQVTELLMNEEEARAYQMFFVKLQVDQTLKNANDFNDEFLKAS